MAVAVLALLFALAEVASLSSAPQSLRAADCMEWHECRQLALSAAERGEYQTFHDLAWRAVQTGPPKDPALMYLLARAQTLSGRPHDALVMLLRLAELGVASPEAATSEEFSRTRQLPGWPEAEARILGRINRETPAAATPPASAVPPAVKAPVAGPPVATQPAAAAATRSAASSPRTSGAVASPPRSDLAGPPPVVNSSASAVNVAPTPAGVRFSTPQFPVSGLAYDSLSGRFVVGDRLGRKLIVVDERSNRKTDLVLADSAGFLEIAAVEIDAKRGDLWVASVGAEHGEGTLHKLQLVSGRPLQSFRVAPALEPVRLVDVAIGPTGTVFVLDSLTPQLFMLRAGRSTLESLGRMSAKEPLSLAVENDGRFAFVAHREGLVRIDLRSRAVSRVALPKAVSLRDTERIRWLGQTLVAIQVGEDGSRQAIRLELNARRSAVTQALPLEVSVPAGGQLFMTTSGDELVGLTTESSDGPGRPPSDGAAPERAYFVYRIPLR